MVKLNTEYIVEESRSDVVYVFIEENESNYDIEWWYESTPEDIHSTYWSKSGVEYHLNKRGLKPRLSETEQKISKNYNI